MKPFCTHMAVANLRKLFIQKYIFPTHDSHSAFYKINVLLSRYISVNLIHTIYIYSCNTSDPENVTYVSLTILLLLNIVKSKYYLLVEQFVIVLFLIMVLFYIRILKRQHTWVSRKYAQIIFKRLSTRDFSTNTMNVYCPGNFSSLTKISPYNCFSMGMTRAHF